MNPRICLVVGLLSIVAAHFPSSSARGELIVNGDFEAGNTGFTSDYVFHSDLSVAGRYNVGSDPSSFNGAFNSIGDHTTGSGNMMVVNGTADFVPFWSQTVSVEQNTDYEFSLWATLLSLKDIFNTNIADISLSINGSGIGAPFAVNNIGDWEQMTRTWYSGLNTSALIELYDVAFAEEDNDFAIDDVSLQVTPVPEPSSLALVAVAAGGTWWKRRRTARSGVAV